MERDWTLDGLVLGNLGREVDAADGRAKHRPLDGFKVRDAKGNPHDVLTDMGVVNVLVGANNAGKSRFPLCQ